MVPGFLAKTSVGVGQQASTSTATHSASAQALIDALQSASGFPSEEAYRALNCDGEGRIGDSSRDGEGAEGLIEELEVGDIPNTVHHICRTSTGVAEQDLRLQAQLEAIIPFLLPDHDQEQTPLIFQFSNRPAPGVDYLGYSNPPTFLVNQATLFGENAVPSLDAFLFLVAKAYHDYRLNEEHEDRAPSFQADGIAYYRATETVHRAGFSPLAGLDLVPTVFATRPPPPTGLSSIFAAEPSKDSLIRIIEAGLINVTRLYGRAHTDRTPLSECQGLSDSAYLPCYTSPLEESLRAGRFYAPEAFPDQRLNALIDVIEGHFEDWDEASVSIIVRAMGELKDLLKIENVDPEDFDDHMIFGYNPVTGGKFCNAVFQIGDLGYYDSFLTLLQATEECFPQFELTKHRSHFVQEQLDLFVACQEPDAVLEAAEQLKEQHAGYLVVTANPDQDIDEAPAYFHHLCDFEVDRTASYEPHLEAAEQYDGADRAVIIQALYSIGVRDQKMYDLAPELMWQLQTDNQEGYSMIIVGRDETRRMTPAEANCFISGFDRECGSGDPYPSAAIEKLDTPQYFEYSAEAIARGEADGIGLGALGKYAGFVLRLNSGQLTQSSTQRAIVAALPENRRTVFKELQERSNRPLAGEGFTVLSANTLRGSPLLKAIIETDNAQLTPLEKLELIEQSQLYRVCLESNSARYAESVVKALRPVLNDIDGVEFPESFDTWGELCGALEQEGLASLPGFRAYGAIEALARSDQGDTSLEDLARLEQVVDLSARSHEVLREYLTRHIAPPDSFSEDPLTAAREWRTLYVFERFATHDAANEALLEIGSRLAKNKDPNVVKQGIETLLFKSNSPVAQARAVCNPHYTDALMIRWARATKQVLGGLDNSSDDFLERASGVVAEIGKRAHPSLLKDWLDKFACEVESQQEVTEVIARAIDHVTDELVDTSSVYHEVTKGLLPLIQQEVRARTIVFELITGGVGESNLNFVATSLHDMFTGLRSEARGALVPADLDSELAIRDWAKIFYLNYWAETQVKRDQFIVEALAPPTIVVAEHSTEPPKVTRRDDIEREAVQNVLQRSQIGQTHSSAQVVLNKILDTVDPYSRYILLSAVLTGERERSMNQWLPGATLGLVAKERSPLDVFMVQALHSSALTPLPIRQGLAQVNVKGAAQKTYRVNALASYYSILPESERKGVRPGAVVGSGKMWMTFRAQSGQNGDEALQLLRANALELVENSYLQWKDIIQELRTAGVDTTFLSSLVEMAYKSCISEAAVELSTDQFAAAKRLIHGRQVVLTTNNGDSIQHFVTPELYGFGRNDAGQAFRRMQFLEGSHFNDLIPPGREAKAPPDLVLAALCNTAMSSRLVFEFKGHNMDWHGYNVRQNGRTTNCFDFGAFDMGTYQEEQLKAFADLFFAGIVEHPIRGGIGNNLLGRIAEARVNGVRDLEFADSAAQTFCATADFEHSKTMGVSHKYMVIGGAAKDSHPVVDQSIQAVLGAEKKHRSNEEGERLAALESGYNQQRIKVMSV